MDSLMKRGGPYWHVIRFLDHPLLPANTGRDVPKIIKHGINDNGPMHPKSPHASAPDGIVTLLYKMGREDWLKKFIDVEGTREFRLRINRPMEWADDLYAVRNHRSVEIGFVSSGAGLECSYPGIRYVIVDNGDWQPLSTRELKFGGWNGNEARVRGSGESVAKGIWFWELWQPGDNIVEITWSGMTADESEGAHIFVEQHKVKKPVARNGWDRLALNKGKMSTEEYDAEWLRLLDIKKRECRGGCGVKKAKNVCSKCKDVYYCSTACQRDDWKIYLWRTATILILALSFRELRFSPIQGRNLEPGTVKV